MNENILARRYATALIELAEERGKLDRVVQEAELLADILVPTRGDVSVLELLAFLGAPRIPVEEKIRVTDVMMEKLEVCEEIGNLLNVLIDRNRVALIGHIAEQLRSTVDSERGSALAQVEAAAPLSKETEANLAAALKSALGAQIDLRVSVAPELLGGVRIRIGDRLLDGSVEGALTKLENRLKR